MGIALTMYGCLEEADALIETLCRDKDPILRWSGMYTMAMAYCGTGNNNTLRRLLHVAVSCVCSLSCGIEVISNAARLLLSTTSMECLME